MKRFAIRKHMLTMLLLANIVDWVYIKHNLFLQSKHGWNVELQNTHILLFKSPRDVMQVSTLKANWDSDESLLTGTETQHLFPTVIYWLTCCHAQTIDYVIVQSLDPFPQNFIYRTSWNNQKRWTMNTQNRSTLLVFQSFSHKSKSLFLQSCPKESFQFLGECIINLRKRNLQSLKKPQGKDSKRRSTFVSKTMNKMRLSAVTFIGKSWSKSLNSGIAYNRFGFKCTCAAISRQYTKLFHKLFTRATESGRSMGGCNFRNILPINVPKCHGGKIHVFWQETFKVVKILLCGTWSIPFHYGYCWSHEHSHSRKTQTHPKMYHS